MDIRELEPRGLWKCFYELTQVPRPSGHLDKIRAFLTAWARERGIENFVDGAGNVVMRVPATKGYEDKEVVTMEAHMDMVPQKTPESTHDFLNDPLDVYIDGDWVKARGTTLGADDGIGVATAMAIFEDPTIEHGPLEAIFTVDEESTMEGVNNLSSDTLKGRILLNLDNETEGEFVIGSAGGEDVAARLDYQEVASEEGLVGVRITLKGLKGGHSGLEIGEGRANAGKLMARLLADAVEVLDVDVASFVSGNMRNAIPSSAVAVVVVPEDLVEPLRELAQDWVDTFNDEYKATDSPLNLIVEQVEAPSKIAPQDIRDNALNAVLACPAGVARMIPETPTIVETSCNLGIISLKDGVFETDVLCRSSCDTQLEALEQAVGAVFSLAGMHVEQKGHYGSWQPDFSSPLIGLIERVYRDLFGEECRVQVVHAGLECSIIKGHYPYMDMVSFGPTLRSPHTPNERCLIPTVGKYYEFVKALLLNIPEA